MDEAIQLGLDLYENKARAVVGEAGEEGEGRGRVRCRIITSCYL